MHQTSRGASPHCISLGVNYSSLFQTRVRVKHLSLDINGAVPDESFFFFPLSFHPQLKPLSRRLFRGHATPCATIKGKQEEKRRRKDPAFRLALFRSSLCTASRRAPYIIPGFPRALRSTGIDPYTKTGFALI